jgi:hypothetical protein
VQIKYKINKEIKTICIEEALRLLEISENRLMSKGLKWEEEGG